MSDPEQRSFLVALADVKDQLSSLVALDWQLLQAEVRHKLSSVVSCGVAGAVAAACFLFAAIALLECLIFVLIWTGLGPIWATLIVGVALVLVGILSLYRARRAISDWTPVPTRTIAQVSGDMRILKEGVRHAAR